MPASEQTWRNLSLLNKIFAVTGVLMLIATIWMFAADHSREWKPYQRTSNRIEIQLAQWRKTQFQTDDAVGKLELLERQLDEARRELIPLALVADFQKAAVEDAGARRGEAEALQDASSEADVEALKARLARYEEKAESGEVIGYRRAVIPDVVEPVLTRARFRENTLSSRRKFTSANLDAAKGELGLAVGDQKPAAEREQLQARVDELKAGVEALTLQYEAATSHRRRLQDLRDLMTEKEEELIKARDEALREVQRLTDTIESRRSNYFELAFGVVPVPGKKWLEMPILDAFNSPLQIENLWSDGLTQDYNFSEVRRFDRCTTCHQAMDKTLPGTADEPAYVHERLVTLTLEVPEEEAEVGDTQLTGEQLLNRRLAKTFGIQLADEGLITRNDVTVEYVRSVSPGAKAETGAGGEHLAQGSEIRRDLLASAKQALGQTAETLGEDVRPGFMVGDVLVAIEGDPVEGRKRAALRLLDAVGNGGPDSLQVTVRRGLPHPYTSHPRLDLFVGSLSPHAVSDFACTVCHEGQGSATSFKWASHTPNSMKERSEWMDQYGWFDNVHWIYPMQPKRFIEATCLKCHHQVSELRPSEEFPDPPAPTVVHGFDLIRKYGCYGCHEINGYDGPDRRIGPDMRLEPNFFAAAQAIKGEAHSGFSKLSENQQDLVNELIEHPERARPRHQLYEVIQSDMAAEEPKLSPEVHIRLAPLLRDVESPGALRKSGPALRFVDKKLDPAFLADWLLDPRHFRPSTRMPKFFGMWQHLDEPSREISEAFEPIEVLGMLQYLRQKSQKFEYLEQPPTDSPELTADVAQALYDGKFGDDEDLAAMVERGRASFEKRGCLACHPHDKFADVEHFREPGEIIQGPDLSAIGTKFAPERNPDGFRWLYSWIMEPTRYHVRTVMPDLDLEPEPVKDAEGNAITVDPAADIVAYLLAESKSDWEPLGAAALDTADAPTMEALEQLTLNYLKDAFYIRQAEEYLESGIPAAAAEAVKGPERELIVETPGLSNAQKLAYVGRKTISRYGCYGCHDIPGFEDAKPIGTGLADWGRKETSKLAFEHIIEYVHGGHGDSAAHGDGPGEAEHAEGEDHPAGEGQAGHDSLPSAEAVYGPLPDYFLHQLESGHRSGFIYQKLREPRSYDYERTRNKKYTERLRMPHFGFDHEEREAVITFVLGLVADPPNIEYVFQPNERQQALIAGREVLEKYNCGGCHVLEAERWDIALNPEWNVYEGPTTRPSETYPFQRLSIPPGVLENSAEQDRRGMVHSQLVVIPKLTPRDGLPAVGETEDVYYPAGIPISPDDEYPRRRVAYEAQLLDPAVIDGQGYPAGETMRVPTTLIEKVIPSRGGVLAKYLVPRVTEIVGQDRGSEAWSWVPPMLVGEGKKVQSNWLHEFLLNPYPIRPAVVLRMPRFNMSSAEASQLVHYFAARDRAQHPYEFTPRRQPQHLAALDDRYGMKLDPQDPPHGRRLDDAMKIVVDKKVYCAQCHQIGDYYPEGQPSAHGPDLTKVTERLRADYLRDWIADPKTILPYTAMPKNIPYDESKPLLGTTVPQAYYKGDSLEQLNALVDLLLNVDKYLEQKNSFTRMVQQAAPAAPEGAPAETSADTSAAEQSAGSATNPAGDADSKPAEAGAAENPANRAEKPAEGETTKASEG